MPDAFTVVRSYTSIPDAEVAKSLLEAHGIECWIDNKYTISMNWFYSGILGGVKLRVRTENVQQAMELLNIKPEQNVHEQKLISKKKFVSAGYC